MLAGTLAGIEMGLRLATIPHNEGGVMAALRCLAPTGKIPEAPPQPEDRSKLRARWNNPCH
jgi:alanine-glyoxylate transaminase/serine-glyoxylate transaminase/serine-pyruvate transaminase